MHFEKQNMGNSCLYFCRQNPFSRSFSAAAAVVTTFYQPLCCLSLLLSIRLDEVAVTNVSDSNIAFSCMSHRSWIATKNYI